MVAGRCVAADLLSLRSTASLTSVHLSLSALGPLVPHCSELLDQRNLLVASRLISGSAGRRVGRPVVHLAVQLSRHQVPDCSGERDQRLSGSSDRQDLWFMTSSSHRTSGPAPPPGGRTRGLAQSRATTPEVRRQPVGSGSELPSGSALPNH